MSVDGHRVYLSDDGELLPGTTDVLARFRFRENEYIPKAVRDKVYAEGTAIHKLVQMHLCGMGLPPIGNGTSVDNGYRSYLKYTSEHDIRPYNVEMPLVSNVNRYGGTLDIWAQVDGSDELVDWKGISEERTLKQLLPMYFTQLGGYAGLLEENLDIEVPRARIVMLDKTNPHNYVDRYVLEGRELRERIKVFREMSRTHHLMEKLVGPLKRPRKVKR